MATFTGTNLDEIITPTEVSPTVVTDGEAAPGAGDDTIEGGGGADILDGGEGNDTINGGAGDDTILGGLGADIIDGGDGVDTLSYANSSAGISTPLFNTKPLSGGDADGDMISNIEIIIGSAFNDHLEAAGARELHGGDGNDTLVSRGNIDLFGDDGDDTFGLNPDNNGRLGDATFDGGAGIDTINISVSGTEDFTDNALVSIEKLNFLNLQGDSSFSFTASQIDQFSNISMRHGGSGDLAMRIAMGDQTTLDLSDKVQNGTADDRFFITGDGDAETITGSLIADTIDGGGGNDTINGGGGGADILHGGAGDDTFTILPDQDMAGATFDGGADHDRLQLLTGGDGQNFYDLTGATLTSIEEIEFFADGGEFVENTKTVNLSASQIGGAGLSSGLLIDGNDSTNSTDLISISMGDATSLDLSGWTFQQWGTTANYGDGEFIAITGDGDAETITGSSERDVIEGGGGGDTIDGGGGSDTASYAGSASAVTIDLDAGTASGGDADGDSLTSIENLIGSANADTLTGDAGDNIIEGGAGADILDGGAGNDTLSYAGSAQAVTIRLGNGTASGGDAAGDTLVNFDNLTGSAHGDILDGTNGVNVMHGGDGDDNLIGRGGADQLFGEGGDDRFSIDVSQEATGTHFDGGAGTNTLFIFGSSGVEDFSDDTFVSVQNFLFESGFNNDYAVTFQASQFTFDEVGSNHANRGSEVLTINIEMGSQTALDLSGITLTNMTSATDHFVITGDDDGETIIGSGISDVIEGGGGADTMQGGAGNDTYVVDNAGDVVDESVAGSGGYDRVQSALAINLADSAHVKGAIEMGVLLGSANVNLIGNSLDNLLIANSGNNTLNGLAGADTMQGGAGNDTYVVDNTGDVADESGAGSDGFDRVQSALAINLADGAHFKGAIEMGVLLGSANVNLIGNSLDNLLIGNGANNTLNGLAGADNMQGGAGSDTYVVDNTGDVADESGAGANGFDRVQSALAINLADGAHIRGAIEMGVLLGSANVNLIGNSLDNLLIGNGANNTLNGLAGADNMQGGAGSDTYVVDNTGDVADESGAGANGFDRVQSALAINLADGAHIRGAIEMGVLLGSANVNLIGNSLDNLLIGNGANNTLNGLAGADNMQGGAGSDTYVVDNTGDVADESGAGANGFDRVQSSISVNLWETTHFKGAIEMGVLLGTANINIAGNALNNLLVGNSGNNVLNGGVGNDNLTGGAGNDTFAFTTALHNTANVDTITDFSAADDTIRLENAIFTALTATGTLAASAFAIGAATTAAQHVLYNESNGWLSYDADGNGAGAAIHFATLATHPTITNADFVVV